MLARLSNRLPSEWPVRSAPSLSQGAQAKSNRRKATGIAIGRTQAQNVLGAWHQ
jgi:hypothetical protein